MTDTSTTAQRLEQVRKGCGYEDLRSFWRDLTSGEYDISYDAARTYHDVQREKLREAPAAYLARVATLCSVRLEWLITGHGEMHQHADAEAKLAALEDFVAADFFAGLEEELQDAAPIVLRGTRRVMLAHALTRFRSAPHDSAWLHGQWTDARLGEAVGKALTAAVEALDLRWNDIPGEALTDYVVGVCSGLHHLTAVVHVEGEDTDG